MTLRRDSLLARVLLRAPRIGYRMECARVGNDTHSFVRVYRTPLTECLKHFVLR